MSRRKSNAPQTGGLAWWKRECASTSCARAKGPRLPGRLKLSCPGDGPVMALAKRHTDNVDWPDSGLKIDKMDEMRTGNGALRRGVALVH